MRTVEKLRFEARHRHQARHVYRIIRMATPPAPEERHNRIAGVRVAPTELGLTYWLKTYKQAAPNGASKSLPLALPLTDVAKSEVASASDLIEFRDSQTTRASRNVILSKAKNLGSILDRFAQPKWIRDV